MGAAAPADPERFKEASDYFRAKTPVTREEWDAMRVEARRQSFTIAGTQQLEVVQTVMDSLQHAIDSGEGIDKWRAKIRESLGKKFTEANASTLTTAFINANQTAYNTGRWHQMSSPAVTGALPWRKFDAILDGRETPFCHACAGTILPHDHPWWLTHWPQCHHRCRSTVRALSDRMAARAGGSTANPASPKRDGDWALAPPMRTGIWEPDVNKYEQHAAREYVSKQRSMRDRDRAASRPRFRKRAAG
jgi:SPP1 gp7 family putative phage head morphogenesis protein